MHGVSGGNKENLRVNEVHEVKASEDCLFSSLQFPVLHPSTSPLVPPFRGLLW